MLFAWLKNLWLLYDERLAEVYVFHPDASAAGCSLAVQMMGSILALQRAIGR